MIKQIPLLLVVVGIAVLLIGVNLVMSLGLTFFSGISLFFGSAMLLAGIDLKRKIKKLNAKNLGGPDLFLAPIGRLESELISKHTCNTCEKEFEGSPNIEFENPNEEVAENLVLAERGKYLCNECGSRTNSHLLRTSSDGRTESGYGSFTS